MVEDTTSQELKIVGQDSKRNVARQTSYWLKRVLASNRNLYRAKRQGQCSWVDKLLVEDIASQQ